MKSIKMKYMKSIKMKSLIKEGSDWILLSSLGKFIDSWSGVLMDGSDPIRGDEISPDDDAKRWKQMYNKASSKDKKTMDMIVNESKTKSVNEGVNLKSLKPINGSYGFNQLSKMSDMGSVTKISKQIFDSLVKMLEKSGADVFTDDQSILYTIFSYGDNYNLVKLKEGIRESYTGNPGDTLTHKHNKNISIELLDTTNKGWKVKQTEKNGGKVKTTIQHYDSQDIKPGSKSLFEVTRKSIKENAEFDLADKLFFRAGGNEMKFYDSIEKLHEKLGHPKFMLWLSAALKSKGVDMYRNPKIKNPAEAEEFLYNLLKNK